VPWYAIVAPLSWLVHHDVDEGRRRLNFSSWQDYASDPGTAAHKLDEIAKTVASGDMAPWHYRLLHPGARLSGEDRAALARWATEEARRFATPTSE
jgi:cytochrome c